MEVTVRVPAGVERVAVLGSSDRNLKIIREAVGVSVFSRDGQVRFTGDGEQVAVAQRVLERLAEAAAAPAGGGGRRDGDGDVDGAGYSSRRAVLDLIGQTMREVSHERRSAEAHAGPPGWRGRSRSEDERGVEAQDDDGDSGPLWSDVLNVYVAGRPVEARTQNQRRYLDAIRDNAVVFGIGPAGTGKTYLAVAAAVHMLKAGVVRRVVLARPAVEAGERLGFLPGDLQAKVNPYLRPLLDALHEMMDFGTLKRFMASDVVEIVPLAYMRGRTLNRSAIILDEAQNTTRGQMKMFLTRMGQGSRVIVTGDTTQIDIPDPSQSGLVDAARVLRGVPGIGMVTFGEADIVRHEMVQRIVEAYARNDAADGNHAPSHRPLVAAPLPPAARGGASGA